jgi:GMP synthase-like glutamine amidotransferase
LAPDGSFEWAERPILEKVIWSHADRLRYESSPALVRSGIEILEPWEDVGSNKFDERVRASKNIAYVLQRIVDTDSVLFPLWETRVPDPEHLASLVSNALAVVFEGGSPSVYDPNSFSPRCPREDLLLLVEALLLPRRPHSAPCIFICLAHQLAAEAHVRLVRRAVHDVLFAESLGQDASDEALCMLRLVGARIREVGERLAVVKKGRVVAEGWNSATFGVARNEQPEMAIVPLVAYRTSSATAARTPFGLVHSHAVVAHEHKEKGIIVQALAHEAEVRVAMFHGDEVNEEAILFSNWAYRLLHEAIIPYRNHVAGSRLAWILRLPYAVEITCSTALPDGSATLTEVAATCVVYKDYETSRLRRSFTLQFHPELSTDLREIGQRPPPSFAELKSDPGVRLLVRHLYAGMLE